MNRKRWLTVIGALGAAGAMAACKDQSVRDYLGVSGQMYQWQKRVGEAICQLEVNNPNGLDPMKRICPNAEGGPGDKTSPPSYPPP
jgi:hypothetical protein